MQHSLASRVVNLFEYKQASPASLFELYIMQYMEMSKERYASNLDQWPHLLHFKSICVEKSSLSGINQLDLLPVYNGCVVLMGYFELARELASFELINDSDTVCDEMEQVYKSIVLTEWTSEERQEILKENHRSPYKIEEYLDILDFIADLNKLLPGRLDRVCVILARYFLQLKSDVFKQDQALQRACQAILEDNKSLVPMDEDMDVT